MTTPRRRGWLSFQPQISEKHQKTRMVTPGRSHPHKGFAVEMPRACRVERYLQTTTCKPPFPLVPRELAPKYFRSKPAFFFVASPIGADLTLEIRSKCRWARTVLQLTQRVTDRSRPNTSSIHQRLLSANATLPLPRKPPILPY